MTQTQPQSPPCASSSSSSSSPPLRLKELLAACVSAGWLAGEVIREVVAQNVDLGMVNKAADKYDPQTIADRRGQQRMIHALRALWPQLQIVGEEGDLDLPEPRDAVFADVRSLLTDVQITNIPEEFAGDLDPNELVLWMDPLDGTKKFAEKKYQEVSVLLGIAYKRRPIAGVMHLPFHGANNGETLWGGPGIGLIKTTHRPGLLNGHHVRQQRPPLVFPQRALHIMTSGTNCPLVNEALDTLKPSHVQYGGATGTMVMSVITGECDAFFRFRNATKRWDICAVEPLLEAIGGRLVDQYGKPYTYDPKDDTATDYDNAHGLIATLQPQVETNLRHTMEQVNVMRSLDGQVLMTPKWLEEHIFPSSRVRSCRVEEGSILRGKQSIVARLVLELQGSSEGSVPSIIEKHIFLKRYVKEELPSRGERQWQRDLFSYRCEAKFYASVYPLLLLADGQDIRLIKPLSVQFRTDPHGPDGQEKEEKETGDGFLVMLENVLAPSDTKNRLVARDCLSKDATHHALDYLAVLHASAITSPAVHATVKEYLWPSGCWWSFAKRGQDELDNAPRVWKGVLVAFQEELLASGVTIGNELETLGDRMVENAAYISHQLFGAPSDAFHQYKGLVHGDFKTANMFFDAETSHVTAFDWQWAGLGLGVLDVANLLNTSVSIEALDGPGETQLLEYYYNRFRLALGDHVLGGTELDAKYPFEAFQRHFQLATLEYARVLIANFWEDITPKRCVEVDGGKTNWGLGYRSVPHVLRVIRKLHAGLQAVADEQKK